MDEEVGAPEGVENPPTAAKAAFDSEKVSGSRQNCNTHRSTARSVSASISLASILDGTGGSSSSRDLYYG